VTTTSSTTVSTTPVLECHGISKVFGHGHTAVTAVDDVSMAIVPGRAVGIAGESGSGKSTLLRLMLGLEAPTSGAVRFDGRARPRSPGRDDRARFGSSVQAVFQDPGGSFNPRMPVWQAVTEPAWATTGLTGRARRRTAAELLELVGLPTAYLPRLPHQLSGGERQRLAIARALSCGPRVVLLDEPVTALDVSVRGAIINLLRARAEDLGVTFAVVSHDLSVIWHLTDYLYVVYGGRIVEEGPTTEVLASPAHPYTRVLAAAAEDPLFASAIDSDEPPRRDACPYLPRCEFAMAACATVPPLYPQSGGRSVRCELHRTRTT
jgi:oligopeptide/dipeptide ABC transporter ATP-binding protein